MKEFRRGSIGGRPGFLVPALVLGLAAAACSTPPDGGGAGGGGMTGTGGRPPSSSGGRGGAAGGPAATGGASGTPVGGAGGNLGSGGSGAGGSGSGGSAAGGSAGGSGGATGAGGAGGARMDAGGGAGGAGGGMADASPPPPSGSADEKWSFFVISMKALQTLSGKPEGFGGDLRFGKATGLEGADELCKKAADMAVPGAGQRNWRAFLSAAMGPGGQPVNARDRIGKGPWYDRKGRLLAMNLDDLFAGPRPRGDAELVNDFTNERGEPNNYVGANGYVAGRKVDNHDTLTGSNGMGMHLAPTCNDWTSTTGSGPMIGHSWPRSATSGRHWAADHRVPGCTPGVDRTLGGSGSGGCVGCSGGYGGFYCFDAR